MSEIQPELYTNLAGWFHLLTRPEDYVEEALFFGELLKVHGQDARLLQFWSWAAAAATTLPT